jgi:hypothetical protein
MMRDAGQKIRKGFYTYAWDLLENPREVLGQMSRGYGCNAVLINANYHHARVLRPRAEGPKTLHYPEAYAAFRPQPELYEGSGLLPLAEPGLSEAGVLQKARTACREVGLDYGLWVVGLHNTTLGEEHPELCVTNCFGDVYPYALCPSNLAVQQYLRALVQDVCLQFSPERVVLEAAGTLGLKHGLHHELFLTPWDDLLEMLFSLCFCSACQEKAEQAGIDAQALREEAACLAERLLEEERGQLPLSFRRHEVASLLLEIDSLWEYLQLGKYVVTDLTASVHEIAKDFSVKLEVIPASFHRPLSSAWLERASVSGLAEVSDGLVVSAYHEDPAQVAADLRWANLMVPGTPLTVGLNACAPTPSAAALGAQVQACREAGSQAVYYYNYGLLSTKRLRWVREANALLDQKDQV